MTTLRRLSSQAVASAILCSISVAGYAADQPIKGGEPQGFKGEITPYFWLVGASGDVTIGDRTAEFERSFSDLSENTTGAGSLLGVLQYNRFLLWGQGDLFKLNKEQDPASDKPLGGEADLQLAILEGAAGYQIDGWMDGQTFDLLLGLRYTRVETDLTINGVGDRSSTRQLVDPMLLVRPSIPIFPSKIKNLRFNPTLGIGGGGDSKLVYELQPQFQWQFIDHVALRVGYRTVGYKFENEDNNVEATLTFSGPILGLGFTF